MQNNINREAAYAEALRAIERWSRARGHWLGISFPRTAGWKCYRSRESIQVKFFRSTFEVESEQYVDTATALLWALLVEDGGSINLGLGNVVTLARLALDAVPGRILAAVDHRRRSVDVSVSIADEVAAARELLTDEADRRYVLGIADEVAAARELLTDEADRRYALGDPLGKWLGLWLEGKCEWLSSGVAQLSASAGDSQSGGLHDR